MMEFERTGLWLEIQRLRLAIIVHAVLKHEEHEGRLKNRDECVSSNMYVCMFMSL